MMRKFAVALIATTMLVAPALAADAVKSTPAATSAPIATPAAPTVAKTDKDITKTKVAHRHSGRHLAMVKHGKHDVKIARHSSHIKTAKVSKPVKTVTATPAASTWTLFPATVTKTDKPLKKVAHRHSAHHTMIAKNGKHVSHVKTAKVSKPVKAVTTTPFLTTPAVSTTASKPAVKTIKASNLKKVKVAHRHTGHHVAMAKKSKPVSHVKTANVSKPVVAHDVKASKVIAN
jgi:hypothetical protein